MYKNLETSISICIYHTLGMSALSENTHFRVLPVPRPAPKCDPPLHLLKKRRPSRQSCETGRPGDYPFRWEYPPKIELFRTLVASGGVSLALCCSGVPSAPKMTPKLALTAPKLCKTWIETSSPFLDSIRTPCWTILSQPPEIPSEYRLLLF